MHQVMVISVERSTDKEYLSNKVVVHMHAFWGPFIDHHTKALRGGDASSSSPRTTCDMSRLSLNPSPPQRQQQQQRKSDTQEGQGQRQKQGKRGAQ